MQQFPRIRASRGVCLCYAVGKPKGSQAANTRSKPHQPSKPRQSRLAVFLAKFHQSGSVQILSRSQEIGKTLGGNAHSSVCFCARSVATENCSRGWVEETSELMRRPLHRRRERRTQKWRTQEPHIKARDILFLPYVAKPAVVFYYFFF